MNNFIIEHTTDTKNLVDLAFKPYQLSCRWANLKAVDLAFKPYQLSCRWANLKAVDLAFKPYQLSCRVVVFTTSRITCNVPSNDQLCYKDDIFVVINLVTGH
jgi:hypothetical protein